ncbi:hypothetical protein CU098_011271, partial [Rhizopus stolonifer]
KEVKKEDKKMLNYFKKPTKQAKEKIVSFDMTDSYSASLPGLSSTVDDGSSVYTMNSFSSAPCLPSISNLLMHTSSPTDLPSSLDAPNRMNNTHGVYYGIDSSTPYYRSFSYDDDYGYSYPRYPYNGSFHQYQQRQQQHYYSNEKYAKPNRIAYNGSTAGPNLVLPWIPYYFHHKQFGIEACMAQLEENKKQKEQSKYITNFYSDLSL